MPLIADMIRTLAARGASPEAIASAVEVLELDQLAKEEARLAKKRAGNAERQQRFRDRQAERNALRSVTERYDPPPPPRTPTPTRTPTQRSAPAYAREDLGQQEVSETWEPRPETLEQAIQTVLFRDKLPVPECRQFTEHEVMRFRLHSRTHGLRYADLDAAFLNFLTKPNRPRERPAGTAITVVHGARPHAQAAKPSVVDVLRARIAAREAGSGSAR